VADYYKDFVFTRNTTTVAAGDTAITVEDVSLFPSNAILAKGQFYIAFESSLSYPPTFEIMQLLSINAATKTLNVLRAQAGTTAVSHAIVTYIKGTLTSDMVRRARWGYSGTAAPAPDSDLFGIGDRFYHSTEGRFYAFTGNAAYLKDTFTRAASATTMGNTEVQTVSAATAGLSALPGSPANVTVPYTAPWIPFSGVFGINASNQAYYVSGGAGSSQAVNTGGVNLDFSFDVFNTATAGSDYGLHFRTDINNQYGYYLQFLGTTATLFRVNNSVFTSTTFNAPYSSGLHTWRVTTNGNTIQVYRDSALVINFTETVAAFLVGSTVIGTNVGFRIGNATAAADATIYFDNFSCTTFGNTGLNIPTPQGWAPTADLLGGGVSQTNFLASQLSTVESNLLQTVNQLDDVIQADANVESTVLKHDIDLTTLYSTFDDLLPVIQEHDNHIYDLALTDTTIATQVDEVADTLRASTSTVGTGVPSSTAIVAGALYGDIANQRIWMYTGTAWQAMTYSGPGIVQSPITAHTPTTSTASPIAWPTGTSVGDIAILSQVDYRGGASNISVPSGWTTIYQGYAPNNYWCSFLVAYKVVTAADLSTSQTFDAASWECATLRTYSNAALVTSAYATPNSYSAVVNTNPLSAPSLTATQANSLEVCIFMENGISQSITGPTGGTNVVNFSNSQSVTWSADFAVASPGTVPARAATMSGSGPVEEAISVLLGPATPTPMYSPMALPTAKTAAYTAIPGDLVLCNATSSGFTVTLPTAAVSGTTVLVKKTDASANAVTVAGGAALIDGAATFALANQYDAVSVVADGTNWWVV
jgi:hypothetical protein